MRNDLTRLLNISRRNSNIFVFEVISILPFYLFHFLKYLSYVQIIIYCKCYITGLCRSFRQSPRWRLWFLWERNRGLHRSLPYEVPLCHRLQTRRSLNQCTLAQSGNPEPLLKLVNYRLVHYCDFFVIPKVHLKFDRLKQYVKRNYLVFMF